MNNDIFVVAEERDDGGLYPPCFWTTDAAAARSAAMRLSKDEHALLAAIHAAAGHGVAMPPFDESNDRYWKYTAMAVPSLEQGVFVTTTF